MLHDNPLASVGNVIVLKVPDEETKLSKSNVSPADGIKEDAFCTFSTPPNVAVPVMLRWLYSAGCTVESKE